MINSYASSPNKQEFDSKNIYIDDLLQLFDMHNLMAKESQYNHMYANALAVLVRSLNWKGSDKNLFSALPYIRNREMDLLDILNSMANIGFSSHEMYMDLGEIDDRLMPCMFIPESKQDQSPLILLEKKGNIITAFHSRKKTIVTFSDNFMKGDTYFFEEIDTEKLEEDTKIKNASGINWLSAVFGRFSYIMREIILVSVFINILSMAMPLFIMSIYDRVIASGTDNTLKPLVFGVCIAIFAEGVLRIMRLKSIVWLGVRLDNIVSNTIFERLLLIKAINTEGASISSQISRIKSFESVRKFFTGPLFAVIIELPFTLILLIVIWIIAGPLVYIPMVVMILFGILLLFYHSKLRVSMKTSAKSGAERQKHAMETFIKMHELHHNGMSKNWWKQYKEKLGDSSMDSFNAGMISSVIETFAHSISIGSGLAVVVFGVFLTWDNQITMGALIATMILIWKILGPLQILCSMLPRLEQLKNSITQINRLAVIEVEHAAIATQKPIKNLKGNIKLTNVGLRYSTEVEPVFVAIDLDVKPGEIIAITGPNGAGKSSLLKLINGLYTPQTGNVRIDGINIKQMDSIEIRNYIAYLPQTPNFFEGTIKENLLLVNPLASDQDIKDALEKADAIDEINSLEDGLDTMIYGNNPHLPTGLIYVLNLARVYLKNSNIILLDELPNASLNEDLGESYKKIIKTSRGKNTVFFITQRQDHLKLADRVVLLHPGNKPTIMGSEDFLKRYGY